MATATTSSVGTSAPVAADREILATLHAVIDSSGPGFKRGDIIMYLVKRSMGSHAHCDHALLLTQCNVQSGQEVVTATIPIVDGLSLTALYSDEAVAALGQHLPAKPDGIILKGVLDTDTAEVTFRLLAVNESELAGFIDRVNPVIEAAQHARATGAAPPPSTPRKAWSVKVPKHQHKDVGNSTFYVPAATGLSSSGGPATATAPRAAEDKPDVRAPAWEFINDRDLDNFVTERNFEYSAMALKSLKEDWITHQMKSREHEFTDFQALHVCCGTYNVNGKEPISRCGDKTQPLELQAWVQGLAGDHPADLYVLGFQELDLSAEAFVFDNSSREELWAEALEVSFPPEGRYKKVKTKILVGMLIMVYAREDLLLNITGVQAAAQATGIMGVMGNKGGVAVRLNVYNTSLCFVNSHLAAHDKEWARRNQDHHTICKGISFRDDTNGSHFGIFDHDFLFWVGDLNYRIDLPRDTVVDAVRAKNLELLLEHDQLFAQRRLRLAYDRFSEPLITFPPTYKFDPGTDHFDTSEKMRTPAYCDRILYLSKRPKDIEVLSYESCPGVRISDHKPVRAYFALEARMVDPDRENDVYQATVRQLDALENKTIPDVVVAENLFDYGNARFRQPHTKYLEVSNKGQVLARYRFIPKLEETKTHPDWLWIEPMAGLVLPGETIKVKLTMMVENRAASQLHAGQGVMDDILILHVENGKDYFISVRATYLRTCFCTKLEDLVRMPQAVREYGTGGISASSSQALHMPKEIWTLVDFIHRKGLGKEGLFYVAGERQDLVVLQECLDTASPIPADINVHSVAETLLRFLKSLPDSVVPIAMYSRCLECSRSELLSRQIVADLPAVNQCTFLYLAAFLREVLAHQALNKCDASALASIFGRVLLHTPASLIDVEDDSAEAARRAFFLNFIKDTAAKSELTASAQAEPSRDAPAPSE